MREPSSTTSTTTSGEMEVIPDHVHLFVSAPPSLKRQLWGGHLWNPSTYVETIGHISEETVRRYIEDQKKR